MKFVSILKQSFKAIMSNKGETLLTILGIVIGIGAVIGLMSLGNGVQESISEQIGTLGTTNLRVTSIPRVNSSMPENFADRRNGSIEQRQIILWEVFLSH
jgi:ABC-type antimicrobial peptide transport system permease subunit